MQNAENCPVNWDLLLSAAQKNLPNIIERLILSSGVDPSHSNAVGQSGLHIAALWGNGMYLRQVLTKSWLVS